MPVILHQGRGMRWASFRLPLAVALGLLPLAAAKAQTSVRGVPEERPDQRRAPAPVPAVPTARLAAPRPADAAIAPFQLKTVLVEHSTLSPETLAAAYRPFVGRTMDDKVLSELTDAINAAYARSDIALYTVFVPEQTFAAGELRLAVLEGYVNAVEVRGRLRENRKKLLRAYLRRVEQERPLRTSTFQRVVSLIRDMPGFYPEVSLQPGSAEGTVKLLINARERPVQVAVGSNNRGTAFLGRTQVQADAYLNAPFAGGDQLRVTTVLPTHVSRFQYVAGAYTTPIDADGTNLTGNLSHLRTRPSAFPLEGDSTSFGLQLSRPILRSYTRNLYFTAGVDGINSHNALLGYTLSNDRVRAARLALAYSAAGKRNQFGASITWSLGLNVLGARVIPGQANQEFRKLSVKANNSLQVGKSLVLRLNAFGQATPDDLPSSEQAALGGDEFGRAYEAALIAGDSGYAGSAELAWQIRSGVPKLLQGSELYGFADAGEVRYRSRFGLPTTDSHLGSVGGGVRLAVASRAVLQLEAVRGLTNPVFYEDRKRTRLLFSVRSLF
jgi:hemolysin activation/secretion protein